MEKLEPIIIELTRLFDDMVKNRDHISNTLKDELRKNAKLLSASFKYVPEASSDKKVIQLMETFSVFTDVDDPEVYQSSSEVVTILLRSLTSENLVHIWKSTYDIGLCCYILNHTQISIEDLFTSISYWVENPRFDERFFRCFLKILESKHDEVEVPFIFAKSFAVILFDDSLLRSQLSAMVLASFSNIHKDVSNLIVASWILGYNRSPMLAFNCRNILERADDAQLNLYATLCLDFFDLLCILPKKVQGFRTVAILTLHRIRNLYSEDHYIQFISCCDKSVRELEDYDYSMPDFIKIFDAAENSNIDVDKITHNIKGVNDDIIASLIMYARKTSKSNAKGMEPTLCKSVYETLKNPHEMLIELTDINIDIDRIVRYADLIDTKSIIEMKSFS